MLKYVVNFEESSMGCWEKCSFLYMGEMFSKYVLDPCVLWCQLAPAIGESGVLKSLTISVWGWICASYIQQKDRPCFYIHSVSLSFFFSLKLGIRPHWCWGKSISSACLYHLFLYGGVPTLFNLIVWDYLLLALSCVWLTPLGWCFYSSTFCWVGFEGRYCLNLIFSMECPFSSIYVDWNFCWL